MLAHSRQTRRLIMGACVFVAGTALADSAPNTTMLVAFTAQAVVGIAMMGFAVLGKEK